MSLKNSFVATLKLALAFAVFFIWLSKPAFAVIDVTTDTTITNAVTDQFLLKSSNITFTLNGGGSITTVNSPILADTGVTGLHIVIGSSTPGSATINAGATVGEGGIQVTRSNSSLTDLTINSGGTIISNSLAVSVANAPDNVTMTLSNAGSLSSTKSSGNVVSFGRNSDGDVVVNNSGTITGIGTSTALSSRTALGGTVTITNTGTITGGTNAISSNSSINNGSTSIINSGGTINGNITTRKALSITSSGSHTNTITGNINSSEGAITIGSSSSEDATITGTVTATESTVSVTSATNSINKINGTISSGDTISITSATGGSATTNAISSGNDIVLGSSGSGSIITVNGAMTATTSSDDNISISASDSGAIAINNSISAKDDITISSTNNGTTTITGNITSASGSSPSISITSDTGGSNSITGNLTASSIQFSGTSNSVTGTLGASGNVIRLNNASALTLGAGSTIGGQLKGIASGTYGGSLTVAGTGVTNNVSDIGATGSERIYDLTINNGASLSNSRNIYAAHNVDISGTYNQTAATTINATAVNLNSGGTISTNSNLITLNADLTSSATSGDTNTIDGNISINGSADITSDGSGSNHLITGNVTATNNITITSASDGETVITGNIISSSGDIILDSGLGGNNSISGNLSADLIEVSGTSNSVTGTLGSSGDIVQLNNGSNIELGNNSVIGGQIKGSGIDYGGDLTIAGTNVQNNAYDIGASGTQRINNLTVNSGATLANSHNIYAANNVDVSGTLDLATGNTATIINAAALNINSGATIDGGSKNHTINGNFSVAGSSDLKIAIDSSRNVGSFTASGLASIASNTVLQLTIDNSANLSGGNQYVLVRGNSSSNLQAILDAYVKVNGGSNAFGSLTISTEVITLTGGDMALVMNVIGSSTPTPTINFQDKTANAVYNVINNISSPGGKLEAFQDYINNANHAEAEAALKSAAAASDNSLQKSTFAVINNSLTTVETRLDSTREINDSAKLGVASGDGEYQHALWAQAFGVNARQGNFGGIDGYNANSKGVATGGDKLIQTDYEFLGDMRLGLAASYANTIIKSNDNSKKTSVDTYQINAYSGHAYGKFFIDNIVGVAFNKYNTSRSILGVNSRATSEYQGRSYAAKIRGGYRYNFAENYHFTPELTLNYVHNKIDHHGESGAGNMNLIINARKSDFLEGRAGFALGNEKRIAEGTKLVTTFRASYGYDFIGNRQTTVSNFVDQTASFSSQISKMNRHSLKLGGSLDIYRIDAVSFKFDYTYEHKTAYNSHTGLFKAKYEF